jgi:FlaG/FlaF family flagellin (archaellin)
MQKITKFKRSIRAISPVISVLLMITIAVVSSIFAYGWVMGFVDVKTNQIDNSIQVQSNTDKTGYLTLYVHNVGRGLVYLQHDGSVYINDVLHAIYQCPSGTPATELIPIPDGQTVEIVTDYPFTPGEKLDIKIVTTDGNFIEYTTRTHLNHNFGSQYTYTITASPATNDGQHGNISPAGAVSVSMGTSQTFTITPDSGYYIADVSVDSHSIGSVDSYTFPNVDQNHQIQATFTQTPVNQPTQHKVTFTQTGSSSPVTVSYQINSGSTLTGTVPFEVNIAEGQTISYTYPDTIGTTGTRYKLNNTNPATSQTMATSDITVIGSYKTQYQVTFTDPLAAGITTPSANNNWYYAGQKDITISATVNAGYKFCSWSANPTTAITFNDASAAATTITVNAPATITAKIPQLQTIVLYPNGPGACTNLKPHGDCTNYKCVDETSPDGETTYVSNDCSTSYKEDKYALTNHGTATGTIVSVQVFMVCEKYGTGTQYSYAQTILRLGSNRYYGTETTLTASYQQYSSNAYTTAPGTGSAWTWQNIDELEAGISLKSGYISCGSVSIARCTQVYAVVTYYTP